MNKPSIPRICLLVITCILASILVIGTPVSSYAQTVQAAPPQQSVKLIFIHHSTGENWLTDGYGNLGLALAENNYFVSDTNYGWGPDSIGDRTDIPNWTEWFRSDQTPTYMQALYNESELHAGYTRTFDDPGGENTIVMFKSCFPNSALEGSSTDAPNPEAMLSVGHAKYVYNEILKYFLTRPDKLFIAITAPPLSDGTYAANARAFNQWLVNDWLAENNYPLHNVAVFDFYNILTDPDAHHRMVDGQIEHSVTGSNTLAYPSGDDHPSEAGSQKATEEFIPMLNYFYQVWQSGAPADASAPEVEPTADSAPPPQAAPSTGTEIDSFDQGTPVGTGGWQVYTDDSGTSKLSCKTTGEQSQSGGQALLMDYQISSGGWATCDLTFDHPQDWTAHSGVGFYLHSDQAMRIFSVNLFSGSPDARETYTHEMITAEPAVNGWQYVAIPWQEFVRVDWEENAGTVFSTPQVILSVAFGFAADTSEQSGRLWIDQLGFPETMPQPQPEIPQSPGEPPAESVQPTSLPEPTQTSPGLNLPFCGAGVILPLGMLLIAVLFRRLWR